MGPNSNINGKDVSHSMDEISVARLWKALDSISERLSNIEIKLSEVVRLEEKVNNHNEVLKRYGDRIDKHEDRIRKIENWQSENIGRTGTSGKVIAWIAAASSAIFTGVITLIASVFMKG